MIAHIIARDKFTTGYINFMNDNMPEWEHHFFTLNENRYDVNPSDTRNLHYYQQDTDLLKPGNIDFLQGCEKIIISGLWCHGLIRNMPTELVRKSYPHFWGGDFYSFRLSRMPRRNPVGILKWMVNRFYLHRFIRNCAGTISLIDRDAEEMTKLFPNHTKHFTAQMPGDVIKAVDFDRLASHKHEGNTVRILAGNSAQHTNQHEGIFMMLEHLKDSDIELVSPLSYGDEKYRDKVIRLGHQIFGDKFRPVVDFIAKEDYPAFLSSCDVGVFNHNQQAALGNIWLLMRLGRKIYIRENTAMWDDFKSKGACIYPVSELERTSFDSLAHIPEEGRKINIAIAEERISGKPAREQWIKVLND